MVTTDNIRLRCADCGKLCHGMTLKDEAGQDGHWEEMIDSTPVHGLEVYYVYHPDQRCAGCWGWLTDDKGNLIPAPGVTLDSMRERIATSIVGHAYLPSNQAYAKTLREGR